MQRRPFGFRLLDHFTRNIFQLLFYLLVGSNYHFDIMYINATHSHYLLSKTKCKYNTWKMRCQDPLTIIDNIFH